jgi:hypothetical protein
MCYWNWLHDVWLVAQIEFTEWTPDNPHNSAFTSPRLAVISIPAGSTRPDNAMGERRGPPRRSQPDG